MDFFDWLPLITLILTGAVHRWTFSSLFERYFKLTLVDAPVYSLLFFAGWSVIFALLFSEQIVELFQAVSLIGYLVMMFLFLVVFPAVFRYLRGLHGKKTPWLAKLYPGEGMLSLEERYIMAKVGDVFIQQLIAGITVLLLIKLGFSYPWTVGLFVGIFGLAHLYLLRTSGVLWGLYYTFFGIMGAFSIPFFIVFIEGGIWYTFIIHMFLYVLFAIFFAYFPEPAKKSSFRS